MSVTLRPSERDPHWRSRPRYWNAERRMTLDDLLEQGWTDIRIGRHFGCSEAAVQLARKRHHLRSRRARLQTGTAVANLLGVKCVKTVSRWIRAGWLVGERGQVMGPHPMWYVTDEAVLAFVENPSYWHAWDAARITDDDLRAYAVEIRGDERWLTPGEVAECCFVSVGTVNTWIHGGVLPARKYGNWHIREGDLVGFVPPNRQDRHGTTLTRFTTAEDARLVALRAAGMTWQAIGVDMGRSVSSVFGRYERLMGKGNG